MNINNLAFDPGSPIYYNAQFRVILEDHMSLLRSNPSTTTMSIDPHDANVYEADLFGLLALNGVPPYLHWLTMRMNNMTSPSENDSSLSSLIIPDRQTVDFIRQSVMATRIIT